MEEIIKNDDVIEVAEEVVPAVGKSNLAIAGGVGLAVVGAVALYHFVIKPRRNKVKDGVVDIPKNDFREVVENESEDNTEE